MTPPPPLIWNLESHNWCTTLSLPFVRCSYAPEIKKELSCGRDEIECINIKFHAWCRRGNGNIADKLNAKTFKEAQELCLLLHLPCSTQFPINIIADWLGSWKYSKLLYFFIPMCTQDFYVLCIHIVLRKRRYRRVDSFCVSLNIN